MTWTDKVIWSEGMFITPQHFQQHDRYLERFVEGRTSPLQGHHWGFTRLELDSAALAQGKIQLVTARGVFPDGTPFDIPGSDQPPQPVDIGKDVRDELIVLALPMRRAGTDETSDDGEQSDQLTRFSISDADIRDSNASNPDSTLIRLGHLRLRLALKRDTADAYTTLGHAR